MRRVLFAVFGTIAGLVGLLSYKTHPTALASSSVSVGTTDTGTATAGSAPAATTPASTTGSTPANSSASSSATSTSTSTSTKTVTGASIDTRYGPVQVKITVTNGKITSAAAVDYPQNNGRDQEINSSAVPALEKESLGKSTSNIDMVSGATYTSTGYIQSLQSALDKL